MVFVPSWDDTLRGACAYLAIADIHTCTCGCVGYVRMYMCVYVCACVYIYIYIHGGGGEVSSRLFLRLEKVRLASCCLRLVSNRVLPFLRIEEDTNSGEDTEERLRKRGNGGRRVWGGGRGSRDHSWGPFSSRFV